VQLTVEYALPLICEIYVNIIVISVRVHLGQNPVPIAPTSYIDELMYVS